MKFLVVLLLIFSLTPPVFAGKISLALNWKAEPQFGGFYAAQINQEFKKRGLDVEILEGGSGTPTVQMLAHQKIPYAIVSAEEIVLSQDRNPEEKVIGIFATYQTYPCMIMSHKERGFKNIQDVFTHEGTLAMQSGLPYYTFLTQKFGKAQMKVKIVPYLGGITNFLNDKNFSQQGFITSEPLSAAKAGVAVDSFMIAQEGFNPYTTVLAVRASYLKAHPEEVEKFVLAVRAGWQDYLKDPSAINKAMSRLNKSMDLATFEQSAKAQQKLIESPETHKKGLGMMNDQRWQTLSRQLHEMKLIKSEIKPQDLYKNID